MNKIVLAISGQKFSGKDSVANHLVKKYDFTRISFADPLKDMVSDSFKVPRNFLDDPSLKEKPLLLYPVPAADDFTKTISNFMVREFRTKDGLLPEVADVRVENGILQTYTYDWENLYHTPRSLAILVGSSMRSGSSSFWVDKAIDSIRFDYRPNNPNFVISDLRYRSECTQLMKAFGKDFVTIRLKRFDTSPSHDPSERDLDNYLFDFNVENKGSLEELFSKVDNILNEYI